jgi:riboflavin synthase
MFTGLIEGMGRLASVERIGSAARLRIEALYEMGVPELGESIAVSGVCLTALECAHNAFSVDVSPETMRRTTFENLRVGVKVNLERSLRLGDRLGGHIVTGHVDSVCRVVSRAEEGGAIVFRFEAEPKSAALLVPKGSVALDGISLTVNEVEGSRFTVSIIPHTAQVTTIGERRAGEPINMECDIIGKYVARLVGAYTERPGGLSKEFLAEHGFLGGH